MTENQQNGSSSQGKWWRAIYLTQMDDAFIQDFNFESAVDVLKYLNNESLRAVVIWRVNDDEETTEKDYQLAEEIQRIHKKFAKEKADLAEETKRPAVGYGEGRGNLLHDGEVSELP